MIIDAHVHVGKMLGLDMSPSIVIDSAVKYGIDYMLVSCIDSSEVDHEQNLIPAKYMVSQIESARRMIKFARDNQDKVGALIWGKPLTETVDRQLKDYIQKERDIIYGIKIHPYHSKLKFDDIRVEEYIKLAAEFDLPVMTHTANDVCSSPECVYNMAKKYPKTKFIMAHMGLGTDNLRCIELMKELPNLYGDTAWVLPESIVTAFKECGPDKVMFGSDNPIDGLDTYDNDMFYNRYFNGLEKELGSDNFERLMCHNAREIYGL